MSDYIYSNRLSYAGSGYKPIKINITIPYEDYIEYKQAIQEGDSDSVYDMLDEDLRERYPQYDNTVIRHSITDIIADLSD